MASPGTTGRNRQPSLSGSDPRAAQKRAAAIAAAALVQDGMRVGLGTGTTAAHLITALAERGLRGLRCTATSPATEEAARALGLTVEGLDEVGQLDIAIDGADQVDPQSWLIKGGGGALTREKIVAAAADTFVVIVSAEKMVAELCPPVPLEVLTFGVQHTLKAISPARLREAPPSPDGGLIADYSGPIGAPAKLAARFGATPGVVEHGLFPPDMVSLVLIGGEDGVQRRRGAKPEG